MDRENESRQKHNKKHFWEKWKSNFKEKASTGTKISIFSIVLESVLIISCLCTSSLNNWAVRVEREIENRQNGTISFPSGVYKGESDFGYLSGKGTFTFKTGTIYVGHWINNLMEGKGELQIPKEGKFKGQFVNSKKQGTGTFIWKDGDIYNGSWKDDKMDGQGTYTCSNGTEYSGTFASNSFKSGKCTFKNETGSYLVEYKDSKPVQLEVKFTDGSSCTGKLSGQQLSSGTFIFSNKDQYEGEISSGVRWGKGTYTWTNGDKYSGAWSSDKMSGEGEYTFANGSWLKGTFADNKFTKGDYHVSNQNGEYTFTVDAGNPTAVTMKLTDGTSGKCTMSDGKCTGSAEVTYSNGDTFKGNLQSGKKEGKGTYKWTNGSSYEGEWKDGNINGAGVYKYPEGSGGLRLEGTFANGVPEGSCKYIISESKSYQTDWVAGQCVKIYE